MNILARSSRTDAFKNKPGKVARYHPWYSLFLVLSTKKYQSFYDIPRGYGKRFDVVLASDVLNINFHHILHIFLVSVSIIELEEIVIFGFC